MNIVTIKMVMMHILTYAVLDYIDNLPVLFIINCQAQFQQAIEIEIQMS